MSKLSLQESELSKENPIRFLKPSSLRDLALDLWRLRNRVNRLKEKIGEGDIKPIAYFFDSCERSLKEMGIEVKEYTGQPYKSSMNVDVVTYEAIDMEGDAAEVKETLEPAILLCGELLHKAKVVVATPRS